MIHVGISYGNDLCPNLGFIVIPIPRAVSYERMASHSLSNAESLLLTYIKPMIWPDVEVGLSVRLLAKFGPPGQE